MLLGRISARHASEANVLETGQTREERLPRIVRRDGFSRVEPGPVSFEPTSSMCESTPSLGSTPARRPNPARFSRNPTPSSVSPTRHWSTPPWRAKVPPPTPLPAPSPPPPHSHPHLGGALLRLFSCDCHRWGGHETHYPGITSGIKPPTPRETLHEMGRDVPETRW